MKKKLRHLLCLQLLFFLSVTAAYALPTITKVTVTDSECKSDGKIEITVSGGTGAVKYALDYYDTDNSIKPYVSIPQSSNTFSGLPPKTYIVKVYDETTGSNNPVKKTAVVKGSYVSMTFASSTPVASNDQYENCSESGMIRVFVKGGLLPYVYRVVNTVTNVAYTQNIPTANDADYTFTNLPAGSYKVEVTDRCGEGLMPQSKITVNSNGNVLNGLTISKFDASPASKGYTINAGKCAELIHGFALVNAKVYDAGGNASNVLQNQNYRYSFRVVIEYPAGSGNYTDYSKESTGTVFNYINGYDPLVSMDYKIGIVHPCSGNITWDSKTYTVPNTQVTFTTNVSGYVYDGFCNADYAKMSFQQTVKGLYNKCLTELPYTVIFVDHETGVEVGRDNTWTKDGTFYSKVELPVNKTYDITVLNKPGNTLAVFTETVNSADKQITANIGSDPKKYSQALTCSDYDSFGLRYTMDYNLIENSTYSNVDGGHIKVEMISGPVVKSPLTYQIDMKTESYSLWNNLPYGNYSFKVSYYNAGVNPTTGIPCRVNTVTYTEQQQAYGFKSEDPQIVSPICGTYNVVVPGYYLSQGGTPLNLTDDLFKYRAYLIPKDSLDPTESVSGYNNAYATFKGVEAGDYIIKVTHYWNDDYTTVPCFFAEYNLTVSSVSDPTIDVLRSGGITCTSTGSGSLTVKVEGGTPPFQYRMKKFTDSDANYTAWQSSNVFSNVQPGKYMVELKDMCYSTKAEISVFNGSDQFLVIKGEVPGNVGHICEEKTTILSVLSIGPVDSYIWYKDDVLIPGATGPTYSIVNASDADKGKYTVEINNGECVLKSSVYIIGVDAIPNAPILEASGCGTATTTMTITNHKSGQTYTWYHDGVVIGVTGTTYTTNQQGAYTAMVNEVSGKCSSRLSNVVTISYPVLYWKTDAASYDWNDADNWIEPDGSSVTVPPGTCTEVHIGYSAKYPNLATSTTITNLYGTPSCDRIIFHYGSELNTPENLDYNQAIVQYNLGYYNGNYSGSLSDDEDNYPSQAMTGKPLIDRGSWQLISSPLKKMVSGDFSLAGYPMTWQSNISVTGSYTGTNLTLTEVNFTSPFNTNDIELSNNNHALALKVADYKSGVLGQSNHKYLENLKGIIAYPYFEDATIMSNRPGTNYNRIRQESTLYYFNVNTLETIYNPVGRIKRGAESYRFVFESDATNQVDTIRVSGPSNGVAGYTMKLSRNGSDYVLMGNPFMNRMFFFELLTYNNDRIDLAGFYRFDPTTKTWIFNNSHGVIYPLESYLIKLKPGVTDLLFPISLTHNGFSNKGRSSSISTSNMIVELLSSEEELRSSAELTSDSDQGNVERLVNVEGGSSPEVYFIDEGRSYNLIQSYDGSSRVALGVRSSDSKSPMTLRFEQLSELASGHSPVLVDKLFDVRVDLSQQSDYTFYQRDLSSSAQYADNNRFELRFVDDVSSLVSSDITIRYQSGELFVISKDVLSTIVVYDLQGRQLSSFDHVGTSAFRHDLNLPQGIYIVKATTVTGTSKSEKIVIM